MHTVLALLAGALAAVVLATDEAAVLRNLRLRQRLLAQRPTAPPPTVASAAPPAEKPCPSAVTSCPSCSLTCPPCEGDWVTAAEMEAGQEKLVGLMDLMYGNLTAKITRAKNHAVGILGN